MKINEVLDGYQKGKELGNKISSPSSWLDDTKIKQDYQKGKDKVDRLISPSQWFKGGKKTSTKVVSTLQTRQSLQRAASGKKLYNDDIETLTSLYNKVESGEVNSSINQNQLLQTIKAAYKQQPLNDQQKNILLQFSKQF
jgi:hypothetical protein